MDDVREMTRLVKEKEVAVLEHLDAADKVVARMLKLYDRGERPGVEMASDLEGHLSSLREAVTSQKAANFGAAAVTEQEAKTAKPK